MSKASVSSLSSTEANHILNIDLSGKSRLNFDKYIG